MGELGKQSEKRSRITKNTYQVTYPIGKNDKIGLKAKINF